MTNPLENYQELVEEEDNLINRIETCKETIDAVLQTLYDKDGPVHVQTVRDILSAMHEVQVKLERELLIVQANKKLTARHMDHKPSQFT
ncbi:hypothetical protein [Paenibacillus thalictri]|uniref:Uncharacterized protein n=1 Tax=Paenibacillus thalictri TaxID=2527873 RepID=A0A4Q9DN98_9BACL|nr:hypothetical protein [Paenibacillus thalictri]TBL77428.1 hypothetical protein EYB31_18330 [Paenibacillus thalictri]